MLKNIAKFFIFLPVKRVRNPISLLKLRNNNKFIGELPEMQNSRIKFDGKNNILFCEKGVKIINSNIHFCGDNSIIYLREGTHSFSLDIYSDSVLYSGRNNQYNITQPMKIVLSEKKNLFIGDDNLFSFDVYVRNSDAHVLYDAKSRNRISQGKSIYIGYHVWIAQCATILKGSKLYSGAIVGAQSVVAGKTIPSNTIWAGNPVREIKKDAFWLPDCVHKWEEKDTLEHSSYPDDRYVYSYDKDKNISFDKLEEDLCGIKYAYDKYLYLQNLSEDKNRFACN